MTTQPPNEPFTADTPPKFDIYKKVTDKIIDDLEKGNLTWRQPWSSEHLATNVNLPMRSNDVAYSGINTIILWGTMIERGYQSPYFMTYKQAKAMKSYVKKDEKGSLIVYADKMLKEIEGDNGEKENKQISFLKAYTVFNAEQIEGLPPAFYQVPEKKILNPDERKAALEAYFEQVEADIFTGVKAAYRPFDDRIEMPPFESFIDAENYYSTLSHEVVHWTKHLSRLNRDFNLKKVDREAYAKEELVAELGACFLGAVLGFEPITKHHHAAYIQSWLKVLKNDHRFIFQAAGHAQKAVEYLNHLQTGP